jgi:copper(I)-binding protein
VAVLLAALLSLTAASAQDTASLVVRDAWSRATPGGSKVGVGYLVIENRGASPQRLAAAQSDVAGKTELHETVEAAGVARMAPIPELVVPPGGSVAFAPGGRHVMFMDLKRPLRQGERIRATLTFEPAGSVPVEFEVRGMGAGAAHAH